MHQPGFEHVQSEMTSRPLVRRVGRVAAISGGVVEVAGLETHARIGDVIRIGGHGGSVTHGEVVSAQHQTLSVLCEADLDGYALGDPAVLSGRSLISPDETWIGRVIDPFGRPMDEEPLLKGVSGRAVLGNPPDVGRRRPLGARLDTGLSVFNTLLPIVRGQRLGLFAGSGVGKSTLLAMLAQGLTADVVVLALVGERSREVRDFVDNVLGAVGMSKSVVVASTSDKSPVSRRRCAWTAMAIAESFRDAGNHVLLLMDSLTRFAEAHREIALATGEASSLRGFPPSTAHLVSALCERAGPGVAATGDITAVFTVLVAGSDFDEPIADIARGVLDGHIVLDREIAERGRFPAIEVLRSVSRSLPEAANAAENDLISLARQRLGAFSRAELMIQAGLYEAGSDGEIDAAIAAWPKLDAFIGSSAYDGVGESFDRLRKCLFEDDINKQDEVDEQSGLQMPSRGPRDP